MYRRLQRFVQGRALCTLLACALLVSSMGVCLTLFIQSAYADSATLVVGHKIEYASWSTNAFTVDGFEAYCGDPSADTPDSGTYEKRSLTNTAIAAGLWYGYGGPGFDEDLWPKDCPVGSDDDRYRVMTHIALAYLSRSDPSFAYGECSKEFKDWCDVALFGNGSICERILNNGFTLNKASDSATSLPPGFTAYALYTGESTQIVYAMSYHPCGSFEIRKASARPSLSDDNANYSLMDARYGIFNDPDCTQSVGVIVTDAAGNGRSPDLEIGTYYIKETEPPTGFALNDTVSTVQVNAGTNEVLHVDDEPQSDPVGTLLHKLDAETGEAKPLGSATLGNAEYTVRFYAERFSTAEDAARFAPRRTWVLRTDLLGELRLNEEAKVAGDEFYYDAQERIVLPLGTITLEETAPPVGYLRNDGIMVVGITASGTDETVDTYQVPADREQVIRGDLSFKKARETDQHRLANIPFRLTSNTTGESHILMTDENGEAKTSDSWNPRDDRTNRNDAAQAEDGTVDETLLDAHAGIWFGTEEPRAGLGALPFDSYTLNELRVSANEGLELITIPSLTITRNGYEVDWGTLDDQPLAIAALRTHASDALDGDKTVDALTDAVVIDQVHYAGVVPGKEYRIAGHLVERASATVIADETGAPVGSEATFIADADTGMLDLAFTLDASSYADSDIVVLEQLTDLETETVVAAESNLDDAEQTVRIVAAAVSAPPPADNENEQFLVHTAGLPSSPNVPLTTGLAVTGDVLFPLVCCCVTGSIIALFCLLRTRKAMRRRRLRASLRIRA